MPPLRSALIWGAVALALFVPLLAAANSPLLAWRDPVYIAAGFAGIVAMALLLLQPLMAGAMLPGLSNAAARRVHRWIGLGLIAAIFVHVIGLWITSPPDVIDALTFTSATPFSAWGVIAMWAAFAAALLALFWRKLRLRPARWQKAHLALAVVVVFGSVIHAVQIEGTMETVSKLALCGLTLAATAMLAYKRLGSKKQRALR